MDQKSRLVVNGQDGPHKNHTLVANRRVGNNAGRKVRTTILRCYSCFKTTGNDHVQVEQEEIRRDVY